MAEAVQEVVDRMFAAFNEQNLEAAVATVTDDSVWIHHGSQKLVSIRFEGKSAVEKFFETNFTSMKVEYFEILSTVVQGDTAIVFGREKFTMADTGEEKAQKWVQVYTVRDGLISRMEEYATSTPDDEYIVVDA